VYSQSSTKTEQDFKWFFYEFQNLQSFYAEPIWYAADRGYTEVVKFLLNEMSESERLNAVLAQDGEGWTLLMEAAQSASEELTQFIINLVPAQMRTEYITRKAFDGTTALMTAAMADVDSTATSEVLLGALPDEERLNYLAETRRNNAHALIIAIVNRHEALAEFLMDAMPEDQLVPYFFVQDDRGRSALMWAAAHGLYYTAKALLEALPESKRQDYVALKSPFGWTAIEHAQFRSDQRLVNYLRSFL
jgi:ankyrin repeat protein